jgi:hypothetical protein
MTVIVDIFRQSAAISTAVLLMGPMALSCEGREPPEQDPPEPEPPPTCEVDPCQQFDDIRGNDSCAVCSAGYCLYSDDICTPEVEGHLDGPYVPVMVDLVNGTHNEICPDGTFAWLAFGHAAPNRLPTAFVLELDGVVFDAVALEFDAPEEGSVLVPVVARFCLPIRQDQTGAHVWVQSLADGKGGLRRCREMVESVLP